MSHTREAAQIPVIDLSGGQPEEEIGKALVDAASTYGFVYVKNEGKDIPVAAVDRMFDLSKQFFASPIAEKGKCKITETNTGWVGMHTETLSKGQRIGDFKEALNIAQFENGKPQQILPSALAEHESEIDDFQIYCYNLMLKILTLFGLGLEIPHSSGGSTWFTTRHTNGPTHSTLRLLYYPSIPASTDYNPTTDVRAGAHSDYGSITLLFQRPGQPGLEILPPTSSAFTPVPIHPPGTEDDPSPPILVNIGDVLSYWTNNFFKSTVHRVVFPKGESEDRYSIAYFGHPVGSVVLEPVPSERVRKAGEEWSVEKEEGRTMTADEHLMGRLKATYLGLYKDKGEGEAADAE